MLIHAAILVLTGLIVPQDELPTVRVTRDDTVIDKSCRIEIPAGLVIADANGDGVIHVRGQDLRVTFATGTVLRGALRGTPGDQLRGVGIKAEGNQRLRLSGLRIEGFKVGLLARNTRGLVIEGSEFHDLYRQHLASSATAESSADWLSPHQNDAGEWWKNYGGALVVEDSTEASIRGNRGRDGQNGIILDGTNHSEVHDNDFSFLSGWGLALWRASDNLICRNAVDFCVRGYRHGVYNRGQDSAGILIFEQSSRNVIAENSATHGGDGLFGFAGQEALGQRPAPADDFDYERRGCNDNLIIGNDFSYAAAHGLEMTFSFGNRILANRFVGNAICGIWAGYARGTLIGDNLIVENGDMGYGLERGGVNIEHGRKNRILDNRFRRNACAIHLWWDEDAALAKTPWAVANGMQVEDNLIARNEFEGDLVALQLRAVGDTTRVYENRISSVKESLVASEGSTLFRVEGAPDVVLPKTELKGTTRPVGARKELAGRENIVMTEWGPWDHARPMIREVEEDEEGIVFEIMGGPPKSEPTRSGVGVTWKKLAGNRWRVAAKSDGVHRYGIWIDGAFVKKGVIVKSTWKVNVFPWTVNPLEDPAGWRLEAGGPGAVKTVIDRLDLDFGNGGPDEISWDDDAEPSMGPDHFGVIANCRLRVEAGRWRIWTKSDDGVRVLIDGDTVIESWSHQAATRSTTEFELSETKEIDIKVEYFELDGAAVLELGFEALD